MSDLMGFNKKALQIYAKHLTLLIFGNIASTKKMLLRNDFPIDFPDRDINVILNELLFYYLNICDKLLHNEYDHKIKIEIMDALVDLISLSLDETKEDILKERFDDLKDMHGLGDYFKTIRTTCDDQWFLSMFNKRQKDYEGYLMPFDFENATNVDINKTLEFKFSEIVHQQVFNFDINKNPVSEVKMVLYSIVFSGNFYTQLIQVISKIEEHTGVNPS